MEEEQHRLHRDHTIAELLGAERRRRSRPRPAGAPAGTPADCARKLRFAAATVLPTVMWATVMCAFAAGIAVSLLLYPYAPRDPARERTFDVLPLWFGVVAVAGPLLIALGRLPRIAVPYAAAALLGAQTAHGLAIYPDDLTPEKPTPPPVYVG